MGAVDLGEEETGEGFWGCKGDGFGSAGGEKGSERKIWERVKGAEEGFGGPAGAGEGNRIGKIGYGNEGMKT